MKIKNSWNHQPAFRGLFLEKKYPWKVLVGCLIFDWSFWGAKFHFVWNISPLGADPKRNHISSTFIFLILVGNFGGKISRFKPPFDLVEFEVHHVIIVLQKCLQVGHPKATHWNGDLFWQWRNVFCSYQKILKSLGSKWKVIFPNASNLKNGLHFWSTLDGFCWFVWFQDGWRCTKGP